MIIVIKNIKLECMKYGSKITHAKYIGELNYSQVKKKYCDLNIELGSMWTNDDTKQYGLIIYVTHISILN